MNILVNDGIGQLAEIWMVVHVDGHAVVMGSVMTIVFPGTIIFDFEAWFLGLFVSNVLVAPLVHKVGVLRFVYPHALQGCSCKFEVSNVFPKAIDRGSGCNAERDESD